MQVYKLVVITERDYKSIIPAAAVILDGKGLTVQPQCVLLDVMSREDTATDLESACMF